MKALTSVEQNNFKKECFDEKPNIPERPEWFIRLPRDFLPMLANDLNLERCTMSSLFVLAYHYSFSCMEGDPEATCTISYSELGAELKLSRGTIAKAIGSHIRSGRLTQTKRYHEKAEYKVENISADARFIQIEDYFFHDYYIAPGKEEYGAGTVRKLKPLETLLLAEIATVCKAPDNKEHRYVGSIKQFARLFRVGDKSVKKALDVLIRAGLVYSYDEYHWRNHKKQIRLSVRKEIRLSMNRRHTRAKCSRQTAPGEKKREGTPLMRVQREEELIAFADARTDRERYYAVLQQKARYDLERRSARFVLDPGYTEIERQIGKLEIQWGKTSYAVEKGEEAQSRLDEIEQELHNLRNKRIERLKELGGRPEDLLPRYHCPKCSDSGWLGNGRPCDCYRPLKNF